MRSPNPIGEIERAGQPDWAYDLLATPIFWTSRAEELHRMVCVGFGIWREDTEAIRKWVANPTAEPYQQKAPTLTVVFFLAALAIENLLKGKLMKTKPQSVSKGRLREGIITCHDLLAVAKEAAIVLSSDEQDFCELGTEAIVWFGRYHLAKSVSKSARKIVVKGTLFSVYESLYSRLFECIRKPPSSA